MSPSAIADCTGYSGSAWVPTTSRFRWAAICGSLSPCVFVTCVTQALCDERHILLECPAVGDLRSQYAPLIAESSGVVAQLVWADDQPLVSKYIIACLDRSEVH